MEASSIQFLGSQTSHSLTQSLLNFIGKYDNIKFGGSLVTAYAPTNEAPKFGEPPSNMKITSISAMNAYANQSHEELRLEDYIRTPCIFYKKHNPFAESNSGFSAQNGFASAAHSIDTRPFGLIGGSAATSTSTSPPPPLGLNPSGVTYEGPTLPCEHADEDESIIALAEFAVEQQNALNKDLKLSLVGVLAACLEAVHCGRYHILLEAKDPSASYMPFRFLAVVLQLRTHRQTLTLLENWQPS